MRRWRAAGLAIVLVACASASERGVEVIEPGCFQFRHDAGVRALGLPWGFELGSDPVDSPLAPQGARLAVTRLTERTTADYPFGYWSPAPGDSIRLGSVGGGGLVLTLAPDGEDWVGQGRSAGDAMVGGEPPDRSWHPVTALRVLCPAPTG